MLFAVTAKFVGIPGYYSHSELGYDDIIKTLKDLEIEISESEPGEHDWNYLSSEHYGNKLIEEISAHYRNGVETYNYDSMPFWLQWGFKSKECTINCILEKKIFENLIDQIGATAENVQTMGTLGSPLVDGMPYLIPDVSFHIDSEVLISCIRVTPFPRKSGEKLNWERIRRATISTYS